MAADQWWAKYGGQSKELDLASTAALFYEAEALTPIATNGAAIDTRSGASPAGSVSNNVISQASLQTVWRSMLSTQAAGGGAHMTHAGEFEVVARVFMPTSNTGAVSLRLRWGQGDFRKRTKNPQADFGANHLREGGFILVSLGMIVIRRPSQGSHRWEGRIDAKSTVPGDVVDIDCLMFFPVTEGTGEMSAVDRIDDPETRGPATAADDATVGTTTWTNPSNATTPSDGSHDLADITYNDVTALGVGHYLKATNFAFIIPSAATIRGIKVEVVAAGAHFPDGTPIIADNAIRIVKGGVIGSSDRSNSTPWTTWATRTYGSSTDLWGTTWTASDINASNFGVAISAKSIYTPGTFSAYIDHIQLTVYYTEFPDAAIFASRQLELRHDGVERQDPTGSFWSAVSHQPEDYLLLAPMGREHRGNRLIFKASRNDPATGFDSGIDDLQVQVLATPVYLTVPTP
jgi:hypothetical protein